MKNGFTVIFLMVVVASLSFMHPAFGHTFVRVPDADLMAKIHEFKAESRLIADNVSNGTNAQWHVSKSQDYWGTDEMNLLDQKDHNLAVQVSNSVDDLYSLASQQNPDPAIALQKADALGSLLDRAESELVAQSSENNATVQALAIASVLNETLKDYGTAIGSSVDLTNMNNMGMNMSGMSSGNNMQGMAGMSSTPIVNLAAYQSAQAMTNEAQGMFNNLQSSAPSNAAPYLNKTGSALNDLKQKIDSKSSGNDVMTVVHMQIHPNLIAAFNIEAVPEFPVPVLLVVGSFAGFIVMSKFFHRK